METRAFTPAEVAQGSSKPHKKPLIIGITGPFGSGKSTVSAYLEAKGFKKVVLSSYLEEEAKRRGKAKITRKLLQDIGNEWRGQYGRGVLAKKALESLKKGKISLAVVDGVREMWVRSRNSKKGLILCF